MMIIELRERQRAGVFEQQRLKPELRIIGRSARAVAVVDLLERASTEGIHQMDRLAIELAIATERGEPADPGHILLRGAARIDLVGDADLAEDLHPPPLERSAAPTSDLPPPLPPH